MKETNPIQVADKLFLVLETLAKTGSIGLTELCHEINMNKTTVHRVLNSLQHLGYVEQDEATSHYRLSFKIWDIANQLLGRIDIIEEVRPQLRELAATTGETVHLVQINGIEAIYIAKEESASSIRLVSMVGKSIPLYCSGVGKAMLADMSDDEIKRIWDASDRKPLTKHTITDFDAFMKEIQKIRKQGYATDNEENELGVRCVAVSLYNGGQTPQYAFSISAPIQRIDATRLKEMATKALQVKENLRPFPY